VRHEEGAALAAAGQAKLTSRLAKPAPRHAVQASHGTAYPTGFACRARRDKTP
jgi:hypothetical protein